MANTLKFGNSEWYGTEGNILAYNDENGNFKPLPFDFSRGSIATRVNQQGLIETVGANDARVDYLDNANGALLLEPTRTNYVKYSETEGIILGSNGWSGDGDSTITQNYGTTPFTGSELKSTRIQFTSSSREFRNSFSSVTITPTSSIWIKGLVGKTIKFGSNSNESVFTLNGEWQKLIQTGSSLSTNKLSINTFSSTTARDIQIFAPQLEEGSYSTSYIPTQGTAQTRLVDACYNDNLANVIGQTEGTFYLETVPLNSLTNYTERVIQFESSGSGFMTIQRYSNSNITFYGTNGSNNWSIQGTGLFVGGQTIKIAGAYKDNDIALYVNGVQIGTNTSANAPQTEKLRFANNPSGSLGYLGKHKEVKLYNTRLSNSELAALTQV